MEKYRFNRGYLYSILMDSKKQYKKGNISKEDYEFIQTNIKELIYGNHKVEIDEELLYDKNRQKKKSYDLDMINLNVANLKKELGIPFIITLYDISDAIRKMTSYYTLCENPTNKTDNELVTKILEFYADYNKDQFEYLNIFAHKSHQLEIMQHNPFIQKHFESESIVLPFYDTDFIRIIKENNLYDEAHLCHEFRHALDVRSINKNTHNLNSLREMNAIGMEFYYQMSKVDENPDYKNGINKRLIDFKCIAHKINIYMRVLLLSNLKNYLTEEMIEGVLTPRDNYQLKNLLAELTDNSVYECITYFISVINGMKLCNIAQEDPKSSIEIQDRACSIMTSDTFVPQNLEDVLGSDFTITQEDIRIYDQFQKKLK